MWRVWLASALAPAGVTVWLSVTNVVDMQYWDDWFNTSTILVEWHAGMLGLIDLLRQHNETGPSSRACRLEKDLRLSPAAPASVPT